MGIRWCYVHILRTLSVFGSDIVIQISIGFGSSLLDGTVSDIFMEHGDTKCCHGSGWQRNFTPLDCLTSGFVSEINI